jgi:regulator of protease activity HflC (stomatin/prohibitin superfamily)
VLVSVPSSLKTAYAPFYRKLAIRAIKEVAAEYEAQEFFLKRPEIRVKMNTRVRAALREYWAVVEIFNFRTVDLPNAFENKIVAKTVKAQQIKTAENQRIVGYVFMFCILLYLC